MTYKETLEYLYAQLPAFQKVGKKAVNWKLDNIRKLCEFYGNPQDKFKSIHIAGTNGKGSSSHYIASILQESGYKVGLYTSPHLKDFRERFLINGQQIEQEYVINFVLSAKPLIEELKPSFFEITVVLAFKLFADQHIDYAVVEVGLGGRLDSTNIINPIACLITNIGFDHMDMLGDTLPLIAGEKAGIIKREVPVVISERHQETAPVFISKAKLELAPIYFAEDFYSVKPSELSGLKTNFIVNDLSNDTTYTVESQLQGIYQSKNLVGVLKLVDVLIQIGIPIEKASILNGLANVINNTQLKGRWQTLEKVPLTICDTGHNNEAFSFLLKYLESSSFKNVHLILGFANDKSIDDFLEHLPKESNIYFSRFNSHRSKNDFEKYISANYFNVHDSVFNNVNEAYQFVRKKATEEDFIFIGGSTYLVAELDNL